MHIHILGICGTFMGGLAQIAKQLGHKVTGSDQNVYPPMSEELVKLNIDVMSGYDSEHLSSNPDIVLVGNTLSRGNPAIEYMLNQKTCVPCKGGISPLSPSEVSELINKIGKDWEVEEFGTI